MNKNILFHVKPFFWFGYFFFSFYFSYGQGAIDIADRKIDYTLPADSSLIRSLRQSTCFNNTLTEVEQDVVYYLNFARRNPKIFLEKAINVFINNHPEIKSSYTSSLQKTFQQLSPLPTIFPDSMLSVIARAHATDLRIHNIMSHQSSDGKSFSDRVAGYAKGCASECIHATQKFNAIEAILSLLFDFNVPDLGHRKIILDPRLTKGGFGISFNKAQGTNSFVVIDFSCQ